MIGDIINLSVKINSLDVANTINLTLSELNIYEDMGSPTGPFGDMTIIDGANIIASNGIRGSESVSVSFTSSDYQQSPVNFLMSMMQGLGFTHGSSGEDGAGGGSVYHKVYSPKLCSPEFIMAQGNYVNKEYKDMQCSSIVSDIVTNYFRSTKGISLPDMTTNSRTLIARFEHPLVFLNRVIDESISSYKSSLYTLYCTRSSGTQRFVYETYENAFNRSNGVKLIMSNALNTGRLTYQQILNSVIHFSGDIFYRPSRSQNKSFAVTYNMATGKLSNPLFDGGSATDVGMPFNILGAPIYTTAPPNTTGVPIFVTISPENNQSDFQLAEAKVLRSAFQAHFAQNELALSVIGNPSIVIGSTLVFTAPNMYEQSENQELQLSGTFLVTGIHHKVRAINMTPRYTMMLKCVKAAFDSSVNGGAG
jgi:hypothetical protein